ncbi:hypothetical protein ACFWVK_33050, partial [Streptomyces sp. NPDC058667]
AAAAATDALRAAVASAPDGAVAIPATPTTTPPAPAPVLVAPAATPPAPRPAPPVLAAIPAQPPAPSADDFEDTDMSAAEQAAEMEIQDAREEILGAIPSDPEPDADYAHLDLHDDVPDADDDTDMEFEQPERMSTEEARHTLYVEIDGWVQHGRLEFAPADLIPATVATGRKRPWLQGELKRLTEAGLLQRDGHGSYTILHSPLQPA